LVAEMRLCVYAWAASENGIDLSPLGKLIPTGGRYADSEFEHIKYDNTCELFNFVNEVNTALSYNYSFNKGDIFIRSASDNTIPYDMWDSIESTFGNVQRRHLG